MSKEVPDRRRSKSELAPRERSALVRRGLDLLRRTDVGATSEEGRAVVANDDEGWNLVTQLGHRRGNFDASAIALSPDGLWIATGGEEVARLWDATTGEELAQFDCSLKSIDRLVFTPDGQNLLIGGMDLADLRAVPSGRLLRRIDLAQDGSSVGKQGIRMQGAAFSPDGRQLAIATRGLYSSKSLVRMFNVADGQLLRSFPGLEERQAFPLDSADAVRFSPCGRYLLAALSGGMGEMSFALWVTATAHLCCRIGNETDGPEGERRKDYGKNPQERFAFSPNGKFLAVAHNLVVDVYDLETGQPVQPFTGHEATVWSVAYTPDGSRLLAGGGDGKIRVWDVASRQERPYFGSTSRQAVAGITPLPDSRRIIVRHEGGATGVWNTDSYLESPSHLVSSDHSILLSAKGARAVTSQEYHLEPLRVIDIESARPATSILSAAHGIESVAFLPDGRGILTVSHEGLACVWDISVGRELRRIALLNERISQSAISFEANRILLHAGEPKGGVFDLSNGELICAFPNYRSGDVAMSSGGKTIVGTAYNSPISLWDADTGRQLKSVEDVGSGWSCLAVAPSGQLAATVDASIIASGREPLLVVWDLRKVQKLWSLELGARHWKTVTFTPDERGICLGGPSVRFIDIASRTEVRSFEGHDHLVHGLAVTDDSKYLLSGSSDGTARLWEVATGREVQRFEVPHKRIYNVAISPDGKQVLTGSTDGAVRLWDAQTGKERMRMYSYADGSMAVLPDGTVNYGGTPRILEVNGAQTRRPRKLVKIG